MILQVVFQAQDVGLRLLDSGAGLVGVHLLEKMRADLTTMTLLSGRSEGSYLYVESE